MLLVIVATLYPFVYMAAVSLSEDIFVMKGEVTLWPKGINFKTYELVLNDGRILMAYKNTILYTVLGTFLALLFTSMGAYALSKKQFIFRKGFLLMIVFTILFNGGMIPTFLVVKELGIIDTIWAMVLPGVISTWNLIVLRTFFSNIPQEVEESARIDGLNDIGIFLRIVLPLSKPALVTIGLFYAVGIWNNFYLPLLYLRDANLFPLQVILRNIVIAGISNLSETTRADQIVMEESLKYTVIMVATVPILLVYPFLQKYFVKGVMIGAVKG
ncbi:carbohydrate ABC transporter permease [Paenibacillus sp. GXUN7292]|uniref:carbohydrate ABC transporter permease n=1 Tax=Paenibacillus sp. GXUN7292 TaxID=3422499 RepID=UPI003D7E7AAE